MADQNQTTVNTEATASLAPMPTPVAESEALAPIVLASNEQLAANAQTLRAAPAGSPAAESYAVVVKAPPAGGMLAYLVGPGAQIELQGIDLNNATVAEEGGNLRITLPNGAEVLLLDYVASAKDSDTVVVTSDGKIPAQQLLHALDVAEAKIKDVEPAAGPTAGGEGGGLTPPTILGLGVGSGEGIFSSVIGPFAIPRPYDEIKTDPYAYPEDRPNPPADPNLPPTAHNDRFSTGKDIPITIQPGQMLRNDTDPEGDPLKIISVQGAENGTVSFDPNTGVVIFTPNPGFTGTGSYSYTITDGNGGTSTADVIIEVSPTTPGVNNVIAADDAASVLAGKAVTIDVLANDFDPQGDPFTFSRIVSVNDPKNGTVTPNADGSITYQSVGTEPYVVTIVYEIRDSKGATDTATVLIEVMPNNPSLNDVNAVDDTAVTIAGTSKAINVTGNDYDLQGDSFKITNIISGPSQGTASFNPATGNIIYNAAPSNTPYTVDIVYEITDARGAKDQATLHIVVNPPATNSVDAVDDTADLAAGQKVTIDVLANDFDPQGDSFQIISFTQPVVQSGPSNGGTRGTLALVNGEFVFTDNPNESLSGVVTFTYTIRDAKGAEDTAVVKINITPGVNSVDAVDDVVTMEKDVNSILIDAKANDYDPQGDEFHITRIVSVSSGTATIENDKVRYTNDTRLDGVATIVYEITDSKGAKDTATITVNIKADTNSVIANDDQVTMARNLDSILIDAKANDTDPQGDAFSITRIVSVSAGTATIENGQVRFTFDASTAPRFGGDYTIVYEITDALGAKDTATITVHVPAVVNSVVAVDDVVTMPKDINSILIDAKSNDFDPQGDAFSITRIVSVSSGTATIENGQVRYNNDTRFEGEAKIVYEITDALGATSQATITVHIVADTNTVVAVNDEVTMEKDVNSILIDAKANDYDPQGDQFSITRIVSVSSGTATIENGQIRYNNPTRDDGTATIVYEITDQYGAKDQATITVHIKADTNNVIANDDQVTMARNLDSILIDAKANDVDPQGDAFSITRIVSVSAGTATIENGQVRFNFDADSAPRLGGNYTIVYEVTDALGAKDTATITVHVPAMANNVVAVDDVVTMPKDINSILIDAKANDFDPQGDAFSITRIVSVSGGGSATIENGQVRYNNDTRGAGEAKIVYEITDALGATSQATITVHIQADSNNVVAVNDAFSTTAGQSIQFNVLNNDYDPQGDSFTLVSFNGAPAGLAYLGNGQFSFTGQGRNAYDTSFTYTIRDALGAESTATVYLHVNAAANNVVAVNDNYNVGAATQSALNVTANDYDPQGDSFGITRIVSGPGTGSAYVSGNQIVYNSTTNGGYTTTLVYEIRDALGATSQATVTITVPPRWNPPVWDGGGGGGGGGGGDCPLTIDLSGDGIKIIQQAASKAHFDLNGDGHAEWTAWVGGLDDAILAIDRDGNGLIEGSKEVFGATGVDGFTELRQLEDTNHDGVIDHNDANWSQLRLWIDANGDGISQAGELFTLEQLGIKSINLNSHETSIHYGDAYISHQGTVTMEDGSTRTASSVFYTNDSNGHLTGTAKDDVLIYNAAADSIDGGQGFDTLKVLTASDIVIHHDQMSGVEQIDLANGGSDKLSLNINDVLKMSDNGILTIVGDAVDEITLTGDATRGQDVTQGGHTYASYTGSNGGTVLVELGLTVHNDHHNN